MRGFVSMLGNKGGEKVESSKNASGERTYQISKLPAHHCFARTRASFPPPVRPWKQLL